jgi:hypothetical protein
MGLSAEDEARSQHPRPVVRLALIEPWLERPGIWSEHTPEWVGILAASATAAQENQQPGRRPPAD